ncbi:MAG: exodeoxyribonuclease V subunit gamma [Elusimicrobiota bacterium]|jgi:ATP-dependent helicase/nuclease subunit B|nr:exodeoxyribonuclease V subunit gamma [Elusimicrobiota bacterium]
MHLFTGHPSELKKTFLDFIRTEKQNPLDKALVVLPAVNMEASLKREIANNLEYSANIYFTDFTRLARSINTDGASDYKPLLASTPLQDFIIKNILQKYDLNYSRGYTAALKSSFRDLVSAMVSPKALNDLKNSDEIKDEEQKTYLARLTLLYSEYLDAIKNPAFDTYGDFFAKAVQNVKDNAYLAEFKHIIFYGFYDFTDIQFELFRALRDDFNITVFYPYEALPSYKFTQAFYEASLLGLAKKTTKISPAKTPLRLLAANLFNPTPSKVENADIKIINVSGSAAEIEAAAKEILSLKETQNIEFKDIALTARSMEPYKKDLIPILEQNQIPVNTAFEIPLLEDPLAAFIFNLFSLARNNFYKEDVYATVNSVYFAGRDEDWAQIIKNIGVTSGYPQWLDLLPLAKSQEQSAKKLAAFLEQIKLALAKLESPGNFEDQATYCAQIIKTYTTANLNATQASILAKIDAILSTIKSYQTVRTNSAQGEFIEEFLAAIKEAKINKTSALLGGIFAADIMTLRGQSFKAVIILGLNEGLLPAQPTADPALKDEYRLLLQKLGSLIHKQTDRYFEEKILFYFAASSAEQALRLIYQRSDDNGKVKIPSFYLNQIRSILPKVEEGQTLLTLSRRPEERFAQYPFKFLSQKEAALLNALQAQQKLAAVNAILGEPALSDSLQAANTLHDGKTPSVYDGILQKNNTLARKIEDRGISPNALQLLYKCPAKYFFSEISDKEDRPLERGALASTEKGTLYHLILEDFYKYLHEKDLASRLFTHGALDILDGFINKYLNEETRKKNGIYPLMWQVITTKMTEHLRHLVSYDLEAVQEFWQPTYFEQKDTTEAIFNNMPLKLRGKIDRIDISKNGKHYRIIDYKTKKESGDITKVIFNNAVLQPPLYFEMAQKFAPLKDKTPVEMTLLALEEDGSPDKTLGFDKYLSIKERFGQMIAAILQETKEGILPITPNKTSCNNCRFETICRKNHQPTALRSKISPSAKTRRQYHDDPS